MVSPIRVWGLRLFFLLALAGWCFTVLYVDPEAGGDVARLAFYGTFLAAVSGFFALVLLEARRLFSDDDRADWRRGLRQGALVGLFATVLAFLQEGRWLTWWDGALVAAGFLLVELWRQRKE